MHLRRPRGVAQCEIDVVGELPTHADGETLFDHHDVLRCDQRLAQSLRRERPERYKGDKTNTDTVGSHFVDRVFDRAVDRSHRDYEELGVVRAVGAQQAARVAPAAGLELGREFGKQAEREVLFVILQIAHLGEGFGPYHAADRNGLLGIQHLYWLVRWQERVHVGLIRNVDALDGMSQDESI